MMPYGIIIDEKDPLYNHVNRVGSQVYGIIARDPVVLNLDFMERARFLVEVIILILVYAYTDKIRFKFIDHYLINNERRLSELGRQLNGDW